MPELVPTAAFAAGLLRRRDGLAIAVLSSLASTGLLGALHVLVSPVSLEVGWVQLGASEPNAALPLVAAVFALWGRRTAQRAGGKGLPATSP